MEIITFLDIEAWIVDVGAIRLIGDNVSPTVRRHHTFVIQSQFVSFFVYLFF